MSTQKFLSALLLSASPILLSSCAMFHQTPAGTNPQVHESQEVAKVSPKVSHESIVPGSKVKVGNQDLPLHPGSIKVGDLFPPKAAMIGFKFNNRVTVVNLVPSVDTAVCEAQTHVLGETKTLSPKVDRVLISRDLPMAQKRFASAAKLENVVYYSDYKDGAFGRQNGLMIKGPELLTRGVIVLDSKGIVRYMHLVSNLGELPDMEKSFQFANQLAEQK